MESVSASQGSCILQLDAHNNQISPDMKAVIVVALLGMLAVANAGVLAAPGLVAAAPVAYAAPVAPIAYAAPAAVVAAPATIHTRTYHGNGAPVIYG